MGLGRRIGDFQTVRNFSRYQRFKNAVSARVWIRPVRPIFRAPQLTENIHRLRTRENVTFVRITQLHFLEASLKNSPLALTGNFALPSFS
jgi:RecB family endonuclease NucS